MPPVGHRNSEHGAIYDLARAAAAFAVLLSHARSLILLDANQQPSLTLAGRLAYGATGLGHQAVIVFFVLSGLLVTQSTRAAARAGRWSLPGYAFARLTRLWTVLVPCLILGGLLDAIGLAIHAGLVTGHVYAALSPGATAAPRLDSATFFGNVVFLQTRFVAPFGSNAPLWSLAYEAWYYALAGLAFALWRARHRPVSAVALAAVMAFVAGWVMTTDMLRLAPVWMLGAALAFVPRSGSGIALTQPRWASLSLLALALIGSRWSAGGHGFAGDMAVACATALCLLACRSWRPRRAAPERVIRQLSGLSYSLYLAHVPFLALFSSLVFYGTRQPFGPTGLAWIVLSSAAALLYATAIWWCFERLTPALRDVLRGFGSRISRLAVVDASLRSGAG